MTDMETGLKELAWARDLRQWKQEVEYSVERARASRHARKLMAMISAEGAAGLSMTRLLTLEDSLSFPLEDVFHIVIPFSEVFYFDRKRRAFLFVSPNHRVSFQEQMTASVARVVATTPAQTRPQLSSQRSSNANSPCTKRRGRLVGLIDWCCKLAPVRAPRAPVYVDL